MSDAQRPMLPIPIDAAREIAERYGYDQVVIVARRVGEAPSAFGEHVTTWGTDQDHRAVAARVGDFLKYKVMGWTDEPRDIARCRDALRPFVDLTRTGCFTGFPNDTALLGLSYAGVRVRVSDFRRAAEVFGPATDADVGL